MPVQKALDDGCDKVVVILTKPRDFVRVQQQDVRVARILRRNYAKAADNLLLRYQKYNDGIALAKEYAGQGKMLLIAPDDIGGMSTLTKDRVRLDRMYRKGYEDARSLQEFL